MNRSRMYVLIILPLVISCFSFAHSFLRPSSLPAWLGLALFGSSESIQLPVRIARGEVTLFTIDSTSSWFVRPINLYGIGMAALVVMVLILFVWLFHTMGSQLQRIEDKHHHLERLQQAEVVPMQSFRHKGYEDHRARRQLRIESLGDDFDYWARCLFNSRTEEDTRIAISQLQAAYEQVLIVSREEKEEYLLMQTYDEDLDL